MRSLKRLSPDMKIVVGVIAASYVMTVLFAFLPQLSPGAVVAQIKPGTVK